MSNLPFVRTNLRLKFVFADDREIIFRKTSCSGTTKECLFYFPGDPMSSKSSLGVTAAFQAFRMNHVATLTVGDAKIPAKIVDCVPHYERIPEKAGK